MRVAVLALFVVLFASVAAAMSPVEIKRDYGDAVVTITTYSAAEDAVGLGSGFIVDPSGVIVTCYHVINGAYPAVVKLLNGASFQEISVLGCDSTKDVAVIKVKGRNLPTVKLADSGGDEVGERVVAIGNPRGLENTISDGLLSGVREMDGYELLQISAPISPGSSGGPVFNSSGMVVGIASAFLTESQNLNFCVPIRYAAPFLACSSGVSLEEFSYGAKPKDVAASPGKTDSARREFLRALVPVLKSFFRTVEWQRHDEYRRFAGQPPEVLGAMLHEEAADALSECLRLSAPNADLGRVLQRYTELSQRMSDGLEITLRANDMASMATGGAKLQHVQDEVSSDEGKRALLTDLACQYVLDAGIKVEDIGARLPSVFDTLPAILVIGLERAAIERGSAVVSRMFSAATSPTEFGFMPYFDEPGIVVDTVYAGKQARKAGLMRNDIIIGANDTLRLGNIWDYGVFRATQPAGVPFKLDVLRNGYTIGLRATFDSQ
jgi:S1-C subfamily serine protease